MVVFEEKMEQTQTRDLAATTASLAPQTGPVVKFLKDCTAGTVGGIAVVAVGHPFGTWCLCTLWMRHGF